MSVYVIIPVHDRLELTRACLAALREQTYREVTVVVIDDGSTDGTHASVSRDFPEVNLLWGDGDLWWAGAMNRGLEWALPRAERDDHILALNNDTTLPPDYLESLLEVAANHPRALIGAVTVSADDHARVVDGGFRLDWRTGRLTALAEGLTWSQAAARLGGVAEVSVLSGRGTLVPTEAFRRIGLYDQERLPHYGADWELARRARRHGFELLISYDTRVFGHEGATGFRPSSQTLRPREFLRAFVDVRSPNNLRTRWQFAKLCAEPGFVPLFVSADIVRTIGGGIARQLAGRAPGRR